MQSGLDFWGVFLRSGRPRAPGADQTSKTHPNKSGQTAFRIYIYIYIYLYICIYVSIV